MSKINLDKVKTLVAPGTIFASDVTSNAVKLDNYQVAKIIVESGAGTEATTDLTITATVGGQSKTLLTKEITIGANKSTEIDFVAEQLAHDEVDSFKVTIEGVASSTIVGSVIVVLSEPRYGYEDVTITPVVVTAENNGGSEPENGSNQE